MSHGGQGTNIVQAERRKKRKENYKINTTHVPIKVLESISWWIGNNYSSSRKKRKEKCKTNTTYIPIKQVSILSALSRQALTQNVAAAAPAAKAAAPALERLIMLLGARFAVPDALTASVEVTIEGINQSVLIGFITYHDMIYHLGCFFFCARGWVYELLG